MLLTNVFTSTCVGLNFSPKNSPTLKALEFINFQENIDMRSSTAESKFYRFISSHVEENDNVFIVLPTLAHQIPVVMGIINGITDTLPYTVYFNLREDPKLLQPLVNNIQGVSWKSKAAKSLRLEYGIAL